MLLVCSHAAHAFPWYISVVHCVYDQIFNLDCGLWLLILRTKTTLGKATHASVLKLKSK